MPQDEGTAFGRTEVGEPVPGEETLDGHHQALPNLVKPTPGDIGPALASGEADINLHFAGPLIIGLDAGEPIIILAPEGISGALSSSRRSGFGPSATCRENHRRARPGLPPYVFLASILAYVGLDPRRDVHWVTHPAPESMRLFAEAKIDADLGFPPEPQELRARQIGHVLLNSSVDRPWFHYFCCMVAGNR